MPRKRDPKMVMRHKIGMEEFYKVRALRDAGKITPEAFKKNFRGAVALRGSKAYNDITKKYHAWLKQHGHPIPPPSKPRVRKKTKAKKEKVAKSNKSSKSNKSAAKSKSNK